MMSKKKVVENWVKNLVIDLNLCPFANPVYKKDQISYELCEGWTLVIACSLCVIN